MPSSAASVARRCRNLHHNRFFISTFHFGRKQISTCLDTYIYIYTCVCCRSQSFIDQRALLCYASCCYCCKLCFVFVFLIYPVIFHAYWKMWFYYFDCYGGAAASLFPGAWTCWLYCLLIALATDIYSYLHVYSAMRMALERVCAALRCEYFILTIL